MVEVSFTFTPERLTEALRHYRQQNQQSRQLVLMLLIGVSLIAALSTIEGARLPAVLTFLGVVLLLVLPLVGERFARRSFQKSPFCNEKIIQRFDDTGLQETSTKSDSHLAWSAFTKAAHFDDGFLLFNGPKFFRWIPTDAFVNPNQIPEFEQLLRANISEHQVIEHIHEKGLKSFLLNFFCGITGDDSNRDEQSKIYRWSIWGFWMSFVAMIIPLPGIHLPFWMAAELAAICSLIICGITFVCAVSAREIRKWKSDSWRFSLKDLLIATTVVALALGGILYAMRN